LLHPLFLLIFCFFIAFPKKIEPKREPRTKENITQKMNETFLPPSPPKFNSTFEYITTPGDRKMLVTAYQAITITETWEYVKNMQELNSSAQEIKRIFDKIVAFGYDGHSGCSFLITMRAMQYIAKHGEAEFRQNFIE
jgi:hypothetical protein